MLSQLKQKPEAPRQKSIIHSRVPSGCNTGDVSQAVLLGVLLVLLWKAFQGENFLSYTLYVDSCDWTPGFRPYTEMSGRVTAGQEPLCSHCLLF